MIRKIFFITALLLMVAVRGTAQQPQLPLDPQTRVGKLDNGLTYYIRHNGKPANRAEFYLATHVGALQELPDQDGLAHFLEHMCFNGTKNFPGKGILNWLESIGASFGGNVNASTGVEQTIYLLNNIPLVRPTVVDTCVLIMHDYSHFVTNDPVEIDNERGVILEEKRYRDNAQWRMSRAAEKYIFNDTKYSNTSVIGTEEQLKTFKPESLVNFYQKWYRPDNQALIVVGDIDVDYTEECIKRIFADIPAPQTPLQKDVITIPDNDEPLIGIITDPENAATSVVTYWRHEAGPVAENGTAVGLLKGIVKSIIRMTVNDRLNDIAASENAPFVSAGFGIGQLCETAEAATIQVICKENGVLPAFAAAMLEAEKLRRFGLSEGEIERAKTEILSQFEAAAKKADTRTNSEFVGGMINHFFENRAFMDPAVQYQLAQQLIQMLPDETISQMAQELISDKNLVVIYRGIEAEGAAHPTEEQIRSIIQAVREAQLEQAAAEDIPTELLDASRLKGSKAGKIQDGLYGARTFTLKNGLRVWLLPTDHEKDRIIFNLSKEGGRSLIADEDLYSFDPDSWQLYLMNTGVSGFSASVLRKMQAGKQATVSPYISEYTHGLNGASTVKDFETALQLAYLYYTDPRFDESEYNQGRRQIEAILPNLVNRPDYKQAVATTSQLYDSPRRFVIDAETVRKSSLATLERVYKGLFHDAAGARLVVVGDFDPDEILPLICKYAGSLPKGKRASKAVYRGDGYTSADRLYDFKTPQATDKVSVTQVYNKPAAYSPEAEAAYDALQNLMYVIYTETLREEEGGTYGASVNTDVSYAPNERHTFEVSFDTNVDSADKLRELAKSGLRGVAENGPAAEQFEKVHMNLKKQIPESRQRNNYWSSILLRSDRYGFDYDKEYEAAVDALTPGKVQAAAQEILGGNLIEIVMRPE